MIECSLRLVLRRRVPRSALVVALVELASKADSI